jgi:hypothetical protein
MLEWPQLVKGFVEDNKILTLTLSLLTITLDLLRVAEPLHITKFNVVFKKFKLIITGIIIDADTIAQKNC